MAMYVSQIFTKKKKIHASIVKLNRHFCMELIKSNVVYLPRRMIIKLFSKCKQELASHATF